MVVRTNELPGGGGARYASPFAAEIRRKLGPPPELPEWPSVSIVVLNRDGVDHLRRLLRGLTEHTDYPEIELIVVDNASSDDSLEFLHEVEAPFPVSFLANAHNESFSDACNQGARLAGGELLLFLNNDAEPFEPGWLRELVVCLRRSGAGAVGPTLIEPDEASRHTSGYVVHQRGLWLEDRRGLLAPRHRDQLADPLGEGLGVDLQPLAVVAACLLIERSSFERVDGFTSGYWYGPEDFDLVLKLREEGLHCICSGRSLLIHPPGSTLKTIEAERRGAWVQGNRRLFMERWGPRVRREFELDRLAGGGLWAAPGPAIAGAPQFSAEELERLGFCFLAAAPADSGASPSECIATVRAELGVRGYRSLVLHGGEVDGLAALDYDVAVYLGGSRRYAPAPGQLNVLWFVDSSPNALSPTERSRYELIWDGPEDPAGLITAVERRAEEIGYRTRIGSESIGASVQ